MGAVGAAPPGPDPASGALNVAAFSIAYAKALAGGLRNKVALWFLDVRNFRSINPMFGFHRGNMVLRTIAESIRDLLCHSLPIARLGGDRFVFVTAGLDYDEALPIFEKLAGRIDERIAAMGISQQITLCAGIYYLRDVDFATKSHQIPLDYASIAHRKAHEESKARNSLVCFSDEDLERDLRRITIEQSIDEALVDGQIQVWYQPQIDYIYGEVVGAEALARWKHPALGWISPAEFIPILEDCGKVHALDLFVWEEACRSAGRWRSVSDGKPVPISVNVSRTEMFEPGLMEHFIELQHKYGLPKGSLHIEVTESAFAEETDRLYSVINRMRENEMLVEMDDFGSGLSSLNMLKDVPVDVVKLDMGFMRSAVNEKRGGVVLGSIIRMLQGLDTPIIAEGVETLEQAEMLKNMGCHLMQGYHFSRPMPLADFESFIATNRAVEHAEHRERTGSNLEDLLNFDKASTYLFNHAIGGSIIFFAGNGTSESILVNDQFYKDCGLEREEFGTSKINPIEEVEEASRATLWRAAAEAREHGSALCRAEVKRSGRWIKCVMRYLGDTPRGRYYNLNIIASGASGARYDTVIQAMQDIGWNVDMLDKIVPNGFIKCDTGDELIIDYISPHLLQQSGLAEDEFGWRFHNSFMEMVVDEDRQDLLNAIQECRTTGGVISCDLTLYHGYGDQTREAHLFGSVQADEGADGREWLYAMLMLSPEPVGGRSAAGGSHPIEFDYHLADDRLVVHMPHGENEIRDIEFERWVQRSGSMPEAITEESAAKIYATVRDLRHHPMAGFTDIKCNLHGGTELRWYHVNFVCDADDGGNTTVIHGFAQDANDKMGSARWWRRQAEIDSLTGLLNRSAVEQRINLTMRIQGSGMMFMIDLDGFKRVNDELGHLLGDELLSDVASVMHDHFRENDILGRFGGDEFVAFMPVYNGEAHELAHRRAHELIEAIANIEIPQGLHVGCSVGVAISHDRDATFYDLLEAADAAMYESKDRGKGTCTIVEV